MVTRPVVSIVTPVFNTGAVLERMFTSVTAQSFPDWEHLVVDDGSTAAVTRRLLDAAASRPGVTVIRTENRGPAQARNLAVERARGRYVLPLDADDYLAAEFLARTVPVLEGDPMAGVVHTWVGLVDGHVGTWRTGPLAIPALLARCTLHVTSLVRRELWLAEGGLDASFVETGEDWDFWIRLAARGVTARVVPEVLAYYRRTPGSRDDTARGPERAEAVMRRLLAKHEVLYAAHAPDVIAALFGEVTRLGQSLQRVYAQPVVRLALRARNLVRRARV
jgi:glycosyltransferase involved in cell wall biosynthesis